jgi:hypothetical protein
MFQVTYTLKNRHIQTLYAPLFRKQKKKLLFEIERFELKDKDFIECYWHNQAPKDGVPIVILFHGLAGSFKSPYILGVMKALEKKGFASVVMHFRGCSGKENLLPYSYHSGETSDAKAWINYLNVKYKKSPLYGVGYSIGGNMLLKLLGEDGLDTPLKSAVAISAPMDLEITAKRVNQGFSKWYQAHLLKPLKKTLLKKYSRFNMEKLIKQTPDNIRKIKTIEEFDEKYTAPINGFKSAKDYYKKSSAKQFLKDIKIPTLIIHALDDPFMTPKVLPTQDEVSNHITLNISQHGGHVGFVNGSLFKPKYWLEERIVNYLEEQYT